MAIRIGSTSSGGLAARNAPVYGKKGDGPGRYVKTGTTNVMRPSAKQGMRGRFVDYYTWIPDPKPTPTPAPAPAPAPASAAAAAPQATLRVQAPTTPQVSTNQSANQVAALQKALTDSIASFQAQMGQQTQSYQKQLADYQTQAQQQFQTYQQQSQAQLAAAQQQAEESQRQMMIGLAQRDRAPAEVKMAESGAAQRGLTRRGTTGYFGRQGMRIGSLNVPTSGLTISTDAASRAASGSFM